jgi:hypothetical protein
MLTIIVGATDVYDEASGTFGDQGGVELQLEHSLVSLSKWESIHEKPFLGKDDKTPEEIISYVECMVVGEIPQVKIFHQLSEENVNQINEYIDRKMTATWFSERTRSPAVAEIITSELVYYWMTAFNIPWEAQYWHLNRLFTLIRVCNTKQEKPKKMSQGEIARRNRELNAQRRAQLGTKG